MSVLYKEEILNIIKDVAMDDDVIDIDPNLEFKDQFDIDSMDFLDIVMSIKEKYSIEVPQEDYENFRTMNKLVSYLTDKVNSEAA